VIGGAIIGIVHFIIQHWLVFNVVLKNPLIAVEQYTASAVLGASAFGGGLATALLGVLLHFLIAFVMAGAFIFSAQRIPLLRRYPIPGALLYGFGVFVVMNFIVIPFSAAPALPAPPPWVLIENLLEHILLIGLSLGILVQRNTNDKN
jgi:hypothetical protein